MVFIVQAKSCITASDFRAFVSLHGNFRAVVLAHIGPRARCPPATRWPMDACLAPSMWPSSTRTPDAIASSSKQDAL